MDKAFKLIIIFRKILKFPKPIIINILIYSENLYVICSLLGIKYTRDRLKIINANKGPHEDIIFESLINQFIGNTKIILCKNYRANKILKSTDDKS